MVKASFVDRRPSCSLIFFSLIVFVDSEEKLAEISTNENRLVGC
jgi:hypothetical protein